MSDVVQALLGWLLLGGLMFGFLPVVVTRILLLLYPAGSPRRHELLAELYHVPFRERPIWIFQLLGLGLTEGLPSRLKAARRQAEGDQGLQAVDTRVHAAVVHAMNQSYPALTGLLRLRVILEATEDLAFVPPGDVTEKDVDGAVCYAFRHQVRQLEESGGAVPAMR